VQVGQFHAALHAHDLLASDLVKSQDAVERAHVDDCASIVAQRVRDRVGAADGEHGRRKSVVAAAIPFHGRAHVVDGFSADDDGRFGHHRVVPVVEGLGVGLDGDRHGCVVLFLAWQLAAAVARWGLVVAGEAEEPEKERCVGARAPRRFRGPF
jgi:hypothetical protein